MTHTLIANILVNVTFLGTAAMAVDYFEKTISSGLLEQITTFISFL